MSVFFFQPVDNLFCVFKDPKNKRYIFVALIIYYVFTAYLTVPDLNIQRYSIAYFSLVIPGWIYIAFNWRALFFPSGLIARFWWLFVGISMLAAIGQQNLAFAYNSLYLGLVAIVIINTKSYLLTKELNFIFTITLIGSVLIYILGLTSYGFLPYQAEAIGCNSSLAFRVSLFRVTSESAALSVFVILWNIFERSGKFKWLRWFFIVIAMYFLIFSGVRSAVISFFVIVPICIFTLSAVSFKKQILLAIMIPLAVISLVFMKLLVPDALGVSAFLSNYFFRSDSCTSIVFKEKLALTASPEVSAHSGKDFIDSLMSVSAINYDWLSHTFNRHCVARYQLNLFLNNPIIGNPIVRPTSVTDFVSSGCSEAQFDSYCESCVVFTYWLARGGLAGIVLGIIYVLQLWLALKFHDLLCLSMLIFCGLFMQAWGVMFVPYNFIFYIMVSISSMLETRNNDFPD